MQSKAGKIISIDGPDGVGKTTQIELLGAYLENRGRKVYYTRASGGSPIGEELRKASLSMHPRHVETDLYISLAMHSALGYDLRERKQRDQTILVDRSPLTIVAYQVFGNRLKPQSAGFEACAKMLKLWNIDTLIMLTAPQKVLDERRLKRIKANDYFEEQPASYHHRVQIGYREALEATKKLHLTLNIVTIDASASAAAVHQQIIQYLGSLNVSDGA